eukprot:CAMPEP_0173177952 /NCGR_PEP_ID=MMETSP1141-20130122/5264_1 /TAXON_ID=483371 /ORGANISM="non described non described, Strain CCMP2298" /LENGTH=92 /DNA_ID=CAMNT_0014100385 /DNA_START=296 /DNA_END=574 /DNA_ORIENTATION=+
MFSWPVEQQRHCGLLVRAVTSVTSVASVTSVTCVTCDTRDGAVGGVSVENVIHVSNLHHPPVAYAFEAVSQAGQVEGGVLAVMGGAVDHLGG